MIMLPALMDGEKPEKLRHIMKDLINILHSKQKKAIYEIPQKRPLNYSNINYKRKL